jgi:hypothetical protein
MRYVFHYIILSEFINLIISVNDAVKHYKIIRMNSRECGMCPKRFLLLHNFFINQTGSSSSELRLAGLTGTYIIVNVTCDGFYYLLFTEESFILVLYKI